MAQPNRSWDRHHLHPHARRLVVLGGRGRPALTPGGLDWSMGSRHRPGFGMLMALWRRRPVHSDQGCQLTGHDWQTFLREHNLVSSMRRKGHDNAVAEIPPAVTHAPTSSTTSRCSIAQSSATARPATFRRSSSNDAIPNAAHRCLANPGRFAFHAPLPLRDLCRRVKRRYTFSFF